MGSVNWDDLQKVAEEATINFEPVSPGIYEAVIDDTEAKPTSTGKEMVKATFKIDEPGPDQGRNVFTQFVISPESANAMAFFFRNMEVLGIPRTYFSTNPTTERLAADLKGKRAKIKVGVKPHYQDPERKVNEIQAMSPSSGPMTPQGPQPTMPGMASARIPTATPNVPNVPNVSAGPPTPSGLDEFAPPAAAVTPTPVVNPPEMPF